MPVELLDVVLLIQHSGDLAAMGSRLGRWWGFGVSAGPPQVQREVYHALLTVQVFFLRSWNIIRGI